MTDEKIDMIAIEKRARALRASFMREGLVNLLARFRRAPATGNAHA